MSDLGCFLSFLRPQFPSRTILKQHWADARSFPSSFDTRLPLPPHFLPPPAHAPTPLSCTAAPRGSLSGWAPRTTIPARGSLAPERGAMVGAAGAGRRPGLPAGPRVPNLRTPGLSKGPGAVGGGSISSDQISRRSPGRWRAEARRDMVGSGTC
jgi:hypothetical protein